MVVIGVRILLNARPKIHNDFSRIASRLNPVHVEKPMKLFRLIACAAAVCTSIAPALAQSQPSMPPVRLIVGYPAGGSSDALARMLADKLRDELGGTFIVDNRPGAGGQIAADYVRQQPGDGTTFLIANSHMMVMMPLTTKSVKYKPMADFKPVGRLTTFYEAIALPATSSASTVAQWLELARKDATAGSFGVPASGSVSHFLGYRLGTDAKVSLLLIPYKGAAPLVQDLLGGQIAAGIVPVLDVAPHSAAGKLKVVAVNGSKRAQLLPNIPTLKELGVNGFEGLEWTALLAPASAPREVIDRMNAALNKALAGSDMKTRLLQLGMEAAPDRPEELGRMIASDLAYWAPIVKASGFTAD
jgi:tripartite-type tricarboxylate transporter receptor subunit TctC